MQDEKTVFNRRLILSGWYISLFVLAPVLSNRIVDIFGFKILVGSLAVTLAYGLLDVINNSWGKIIARQVVVASMIVRIFVATFIALSFLLPTFVEELGYREIIGMSFRIYIAGEIGTFISQYFIDVPLFQRMKNIGGGFWIRYNVTTLISQIISVTLMVSIAFYGTGKSLFSIMMGQLALRCVVTALLTPLFSLLAKGAMWQKSSL